ncbi:MULTISPECIES: methionyl-tRNA formyltransferase [Planococcus]|uniref:Methionyl-tRNA formyltransferase n=1 Tax=Planococcus wigleyi TaxID=2762216 RepID=A0ABR8W9X6_9BACL|nr:MULTISPECIES: methionyl-tRNA formyltransferase [Planococcus]MBD8013809.1 methionyl-tRNA formyltransferase [Planococcus wigleyi]MBF6632646.1 methionyl-tRNA formyltransferase [Planococcus sp. (in: firmicutes)]MDN3437706.1 methionyl-tRNA formyltransferase [Planococcus sp. APC 3900]
MTKIVFMGTPAFSAPILRMLVEEGYEVISVVTQPDRPVGRKKIMTATPVKEEAMRLGLPVYQPEKLKNPEELQHVLDLEADLIVTAAFGQILPSEILEAPKLGAINVHASLLPAYRGGAPIHQAIMDGQKETGVTIMYMVDRLDAGDIISQVVVPIEERDHTGSMFDKLSIAGRDLLKRTLPPIIAGTNERIPQDEQAVTYARNISREQERIDWSKPAAAIYNQVRGLHPWPVAYTTFNGANMKIWWAEKTSSNASGQAGKVVGLTEDSILVQTGEGVLAITELQPAGKKRMTAKEYLKGPKIQAGDLFE